MFPCALKEKISKFVFDSDGRIFSALIDFGSCKFNLGNVYAPNTVTGRKVFFFQNLHQYFLSPCRIIARILSLCERRRGPRSDPVLNGLKKGKNLLVISFVAKIKGLLKILLKP